MLLLFLGGRLLGELYPLRAFSDVRYKWTSDVQRVVLEPLGNKTKLSHLNISFFRSWNSASSSTYTALLDSQS